MHIDAEPDRGPELTAPESSHWKRIGVELIAWLRTLASAAVSATWPLGDARSFAP